MNITDGDTNLIRAFETVSQCWLEVTGLAETLDELFEEELRQLPANLRMKYDGNPVVASRNDKSDYLSTDLATSFPLKNKFSSQSAAPDMYIGYQVSMLGDGIFQDAKAPLIHVFLWGCQADFDDFYFSFPLDEDSSLSLDSSRLFVWGESAPSTWTERQWSFSIKLTDMNNRQNLLDSVVKPALSLLGMVSANDALPDNLPGLVLYPLNVLPPSTE